MKVYTADFNANSPTEKWVNVPNFSQSKIGVKVEKDGKTVELSGSQVHLIGNGGVINSDGVTNGYVTFPLTTGGKCDDIVYTLSCDKQQEIITGTAFLSATDRPQLRPLIFETLKDDVKGKTVTFADIKMEISDGSTPNIKVQDENLKSIAQFYMKTGKIYDSVKKAYVESYTFPEDTGKIYVDSTKMNEDITGIITITLGESFKSNFKITVNSVKSSILEKDSGVTASITASAPLVISEGNISLTAEYADNSKVNSLSSTVGNLSGDIVTVKSYIPEQTTAENQLADKNFVNSSIATSTAVFKGTYNSVSQLPSTGVDINDYAFVISSDTEGNTLYCRYKYNDTWAFEYALNNSSFTANQWSAINSGITGTLVAELTAIPGTYATKSELTSMIQTVTEETWSEISATATEGTIYFVI